MQTLGDTPLHDMTPGINMNMMDIVMTMITCMKVDLWALSDMVGLRNYTQVTKRAMCFIWHQQKTEI
jgi:hypothetical protein